MSKRAASAETAITFPNHLIEEVEAVAKEIGISRSKLIGAALQDFLNRRREDSLAEATEQPIASQRGELSEEDEVWLAHNREQIRKTGISLPGGLFAEVKAAAKALGFSPTDLVCTALSDFLIRHSSSETTRRLNKSYIKHPPEPDPFLDYLVLEGMKRTEWKE